MKDATIEKVRSFWDANPLCAAGIPHPPGTREFYEAFDRLREANESLEFSEALHEFKAFSGKKVLDVGCGNGYVLSRYARAGADVQGVDITPKAIELSRRRFELQGLKGRFDEANAEALPFADATFDLVCSMGVLHHTPDTAKAVAEIHRVLKPGGRLIVMFYHRNSVLYRLMMPVLSWKTGKSIEQQVDEVDGIGNPKGDVYSKNELRRLLKDFDRLELFAGWLEKGHIPVVGRWAPSILVRWLAHHWGWFLYAKALKSM